MRRELHKFWIALVMLVIIMLQHTVSFALTYEVADKMYDATTKATLLGVTATVGEDFVPGDDVYIDSVNLTAEFLDKYVENDKPILLIGNIVLGGADADNYEVVLPDPADSLLLASIFGAGNGGSGDTIPPGQLGGMLTLSGLTIADKMFDGNTSATITSFGNLISVYPGDNVWLDTTDITAAFIDPAVGTHKRVLLSGAPTLRGPDAVNYAFILPDSVFANITAAHNAELVNIVPSKGELTPTFASNVYDYGIMLPCGELSVDIKLDARVGDTIRIDDVDYETSTTYAVTMGAEELHRDITVYVTNGFSNATYHIRVMAPRKAEILLLRSRINVVEVIANPANNGGYEMVPNGYQWYVNGVPMSGQTSGVLYMKQGFSMNAEYSVSVTFANETKAMVCGWRNTIIQSSSVKVYPNPVSTLLTIEIQGGEVEGMLQPSVMTTKDVQYIEVYTTSGTLVATYPVSGSSTVVDVSSLAPEHYLLRINGETVKIVKR